MDMSENAKKASVPGHHGRFPFAPDKKKPAVLRREDNLPRLYGCEPNYIPTRTCVSTDKIHASEFSVLPGKYFDPPDIHTGDEVYYVKKGEAQILNPETGQVHKVEEGDFFYIPAGTWHQVYNFSCLEVVFINWIAPQLWSDKDRGASITFDKRPVYYKGRRIESGK